MSKMPKAEFEAKLALARQLLQQRSAMLRNSLTPVDWLCFKLGCSLATAERLLEAAREEQEECSVDGCGRPARYEVGRRRVCEPHVRSVPDDDGAGAIPIIR